MIHQFAICESNHLGDGSNVWAFAHILPNAIIGKDCNICDHVFIENDVIIGDRVTIKSGVQLWDGLRVADDVFIGPNATFTNDKKPRSKQRLKEPIVTVVEAGASVGANATILPGVTIGRSSMVGAGAVVTRNVPPFAIVIGNPARISGYVSDQSGSQQPSNLSKPRTVDQPLLGDGTAVHRLTQASDMRGNLVAFEFSTDCPFDPKRMFIVYGVPDESVRGEHAHHKCHQFLVVASGSVSVDYDNGEQKGTIVLEDPAIGLHIPPMTWASQYRFSRDAALVVLASHEYQESDYIREYQTFYQLVKNT